MILFKCCVVIQKASYSLGMDSDAGYSVAGVASPAFGEGDGLADILGSTCSITGAIFRSMRSE